MAKNRKAERSKFSVSPFVALGHSSRKMVAMFSFKEVVCAAVAGPEVAGEELVDQEDKLVVESPQTYSLLHSKKNPVISRYQGI